MLAAGAGKGAASVFYAGREEERKRAKALADSLAGQDDSAISALIDEAEKSDQREMIIGYNVLLNHYNKDSNSYMTESHLKSAAESFLEDCTKKDLKSWITKIFYKSH